MILLFLFSFLFTYHTTSEVSPYLPPTPEEQMTPPTPVPPPPTPIPWAGVTTELPLVTEQLTTSATLTGQGLSTQTNFNIHLWLLSYFPFLSCDSVMYMASFTFLEACPQISLPIECPCARTTMVQLDSAVYYQVFYKG